MSQVLELPSLKSPHQSPHRPPATTSFYLPLAGSISYKPIKTWQIRWHSQGESAKIESNKGDRKPRERGEEDEVIQMSNTTQSSGHPDALLTVEEVCDALRISKGTFYKELKSGHLLAIKIGGRRLIPTSSLARYVELKIDEARSYRAEHPGRYL